jgi:hypothetical protein
MYITSLSAVPGFAEIVYLIYEVLESLRNRIVSIKYLRGRLVSVKYQLCQILLVEQLVGTRQKLFMTHKFIKLQAKCGITSTADSVKLIFRVFGN